MTSLSFATTVKSMIRGSRTLLVVAPPSVLKPRAFPGVLDKSTTKLLIEMARDASPGDLGTTVCSLTGGRAPRRVCLGLLPETRSRYNSPARPGAIRRVVGNANFDDKGKNAILFILDDPAHLLAAINAAGRALPLFNRKSGDSSERRVELLAIDRKGVVVPVDDIVKHTLTASRESAELVDTPPTELNPHEYAQRVKAILKPLANVKIKEIVGDNLVKQNLLGIHSVGRAALDAPRMLIATYTPPRDIAAEEPRHFALVGKGVTYDTGGLNLKISGTMRNMKCDMGGSAAVFGAFRVLAASGFKHKLSLIMCMAENAIGPASYKPDDIITVHSGKTVEIHNTDAEGRMLLIDGVSYAARELKCDTVFDAATLTGAQMISTGMMHAAIVSNDAEVEAATLAAGRVTGDLCHPLPFAPEFFKREFESQVADMTNSVHNRMNAQSACAAQFVYWHLEGTDVRWCHVDLAGPAFRSTRGTGYGVALLSQTLRDLTAEVAEDEDE
ncbi:MAG: leucyl aminopeptidase family protein [Myxococcales bacterium]|nr:leucyl aminopeptidase family protein [Myxococcales bacterium]MCB9752424.1 leucyl aminopeptidase family protein [Myxococcales bacterium]